MLFCSALVTPGPPDSQCSHRAELSGLLEAITTINKFCDYIMSLKMSFVLGDGGDVVVDVGVKLEGVYG